MNTEEIKYTKLYNYVRGWLEARRFFTALGALGFAKTKHIGTRKDQVTPEFSHQLHMARFVMNLDMLIKNPERCITLICLHDVIEDGYASQDDIARVFGEDIALATKRLSKMAGAHKLHNDIYYPALLEDVDVCLVKGVDRIHNLETMAGVFTCEKKQLYVEETESYTLPLLKDARNRYPDHASVFNLLRHVMIVYTDLVREELKAIAAMAV